MKKALILLASLAFLSACGSSTNDSSGETSASVASTSTTSTAVSQSDSQRTTSQATSETAVTTSPDVASTNQSTSEIATTTTSPIADSDTTTSAEAADDNYYHQIKEAWQTQLDYIESIAEEDVKQSLQTPFAAANSEASLLEIQNPDDIEAIQAALKKVLDGE